MISLYYIHQLFNAILTFFKIQNVELAQDIINVNHNDNSFVNCFKCHDLRVQRIEIVFFNELNSIKIEKILQISRTLSINVQLFSLNQLNRNVFKLMIINSHLIVDTSFALVLFQEKTKICYLLRIFIFVLLLHFFVKDCSIAINIRNQCLYKFNNLSFTVTKELNSSFFYNDFIFIAQLLKTLQKFNNIVFIEV